MKIPHGGPAYPVPANVLMNHTADPVEALGGMSLRDRMAIEAMGVLLAQMDIHLWEYAPDTLREYMGVTVARRAYAAADAMLLEREK